MWLALCSVGFTPDKHGKGGSFGYGKAGLIRGSNIRVVIAYTCFSEQANEPGVTRRLLGMTYWGSHRVGQVSYTGSARFGSIGDDIALPFENEEADRIAVELGLAKRDSKNRDDIGTTFLLIEPTVAPQDLILSAERYWWPALQDHKLNFHLKVVDEHHKFYYPRPKRNPDLNPFLEAFEIATTPQDSPREEVRRVELQPIGKFNKPGILAMKVNKSDWSFPSEIAPQADFEHRSLVALVRKPRMVVEYLEAGQTEPFVRGVFVADESVNEALRQTEPKAHDAWQNKTGEDVQNDFAELARVIISRIKLQVNKFRAEVKPTPKPAAQMQLPEFDRIMRSLLSGQGPGKVPPIVDPRLFSISPGGVLKACRDNRIQLTGFAEIKFSDNHDPNENQSEDRGAKELG